MGCTRFGNLQTMEALPNSRLVATFGTTAFHQADVRPIAEGRGFFPDLWLDVQDPVAFLQSLPSP